MAVAKTAAAEGAAAAGAGWPVHWDFRGCAGGVTAGRFVEPVRAVDGAAAGVAGVWDSSAVAGRSKII